MSDVNKRSRRKKPLTAASLLPEVIETVLALEKRLDTVETDALTTATILKGIQEKMATANERIGTLEHDTGETSRLLSELTTTVTDLATTVGTLNDTVKTNAEHIGVTTKIVGQHVLSFNKIEEAERARTVLIEGLSEPKGREDLRQLIDDLFSELGLDYGNEKVDAIFRLGRVSKDRPDFKRPIVVKLSNRGIKGDIFRNVRQLQGKKDWRGISIMDQLDEQERREYNDLRSIFFLAKKVGVKRLKLRQRSIVIDGYAYRHADLGQLPYRLTLKNATTVITPDGIGFKSVHNPLSNLFPCAVEHGHYEYKSVEQALQYLKAKGAGDTDAAIKILQSKDPYEMMKIGAKVDVADDWKKGETKLVYSLLMSKFEDPVHRKLLLATKQKNLYELTYHKTYGCGHHLGNAHKLTKDKVVGGNLLGLLLEKARGEIRDEIEAKKPEGEAEIEAEIEAGSEEETDNTSNAGSTSSSSNPWDPLPLVNQTPVLDDPAAAPIPLTEEAEKEPDPVPDQTPPAAPAQGDPPNPDTTHM